MLLLEVLLFNHAGTHTNTHTHIRERKKGFGNNI